MTALAQAKDNVLVQPVDVDGEFVSLVLVVDTSYTMGKKGGGTLKYLEDVVLAVYGLVGWVRRGEDAVSSNLWQTLAARQKKVRLILMDAGEASDAAPCVAAKNCVAYASHFFSPFSVEHQQAVRDLTFTLRAFTLKPESHLINSIAALSYLLSCFSISPTQPTKAEPPSYFDAYPAGYCVTRDPANTLAQAVVFVLTNEALADDKRTTGPVLDFLSDDAGGGESEDLLSWKMVVNVVVLRGRKERGLVDGDAAGDEAMKGHALTRLAVASGGYFVVLEPGCEREDRSFQLQGLLVSLAAAFCRSPFFTAALNFPQCEPVLSTPPALQAPASPSCTAPFDIPTSTHLFTPLTNRPRTWPFTRPAHSQRLPTFEVRKTQDPLFTSIFAVDSSGELPQDVDGYVCTVSVVSLSPGVYEVAQAGCAGEVVGALRVSDTPLNGPGPQGFGAAAGGLLLLAVLPWGYGWYRRVLDGAADADRYLAAVPASHRDAAAAVLRAKRPPADPAAPPPATHPPQPRPGNAPSPRECEAVARRITAAVLAHRNAAKRPRTDPPAALPEPKKRRTAGSEAAWHPFSFQSALCGAGGVPKLFAGAANAEGSGDPPPAAAPGGVKACAAAFKAEILARGTRTAGAPWWEVACEDSIGLTAKLSMVRNPRARQPRGAAAGGPGDGVAFELTAVTQRPPANWRSSVADKTPGGLAAGARHQLLADRLFCSRFSDDRRKALLPKVTRAHLSSLEEAIHVHRDNPAHNVPVTAMSDANLCHPRRAPGVPLRPVVPPCPAWYVPNAHGHSKYKKLKSSLSGRLSPKQDDDDLLFAASFSHVEVDDIDATMPQEDSAGHLHSGSLSPPLAPIAPPAEPSAAAPKDAALKEAAPPQAAPLTPPPFFSKWKEQKPASLNDDQPPPLPSATT
ncbi:hypothetical protein DIPPA_06186 [Diplonema papillatum]|nr:hypothetical protein DIPPA_06186 [Diplonema papillatum]